MTHDEIGGIKAHTLLGRLVAMERNAVRLGEDHSESMLHMSGLEGLMGFMMKECFPA